MELTETQRHYWQKNLRITALLLGIWFFVTFVIGWFARDLNFAFFARERQLVALTDAAERLAGAAAHADAHAPPIELLAEDLRAAQDAFSSITGEFTADDLLGEIFSRFCIGK